MWMQKEVVCDSSPGPTSTAALGLFIPECPQGVASLLWASGWSSLAGSAGTALGGNSDAALVGLKRLLERPALLHPTLMPSQICRLRFGRGSKAIKSYGFNRVCGMCSKKPYSSTRFCSSPFSSQSSCRFDFAKYFSASLIVGQVKFPVLIFEQG